MTTQPTPIDLGEERLRDYYVAGDGRQGTAESRRREAIRLSKITQQDAQRAPRELT